MAKKEKSGVSWLNSIQTKIAVTIFVVTTAVLGGFSAYNLQQTHARLQDSLHDLAKTTVERLAKHVEVPLWSLNKSQILDSIQAAMLDSRIQAVVIRGEKAGSIYVGRKRIGGSQKLLPVKNTDSLQKGLVLSSMRIFHQTKVNGNERIGTLEVYVNPSFVHQLFQQAQANELIRICIIDLVLVVTTLLLLKYLLVNRLTQLTLAAEAISKGDMGLRVDTKSKDEIGLLSNALSKLQISLKIAMDRMSRSRKSGSGS